MSANLCAQTDVPQSAVGLLPRIPQRARMAALRLVAKEAKRYARGIKKVHRTVEKLVLVTNTVRRNVMRFRVPLTASGARGQSLVTVQGLVVGATEYANELW